MTVLFNHQLIFLFLFFLPPISFSYCPTNLSCDPNIKIQHPFYTRRDDAYCNGTYLIQCNGLIPTIQFKDIIKGDTVNYTVKNISYDDDNTITIQPQDYPTFYSDSMTCSFLYNFTNPIPHFELPHPYVVEAYAASTLFSCKLGKQDFPILRDNYHYSVCKDFSFYYSNQSKEGLSSTCRAPVAPLREYRLSFAKVDDGLSLLLAGFSNSLKLDPGCFQDKYICNGAVNNRHKKIIIVQNFTITSNGEKNQTSVKMLKPF